MSKVTFGQLDQVLLSLGFTVRVAEGRARVYQHEQKGAIIYLPDRPLTEAAQPYHRVTVETALNYYGISDPTDFETRIQKAG